MDIDYATATPTEVALRQHIAKLEAQIFHLEGVKGMLPRALQEPVTLELAPPLPDTITLQKSADLTANFDRVGRMHVRVTGRTLDGFVVADYRPPGYAMSRREAANLMDDLHRSVLHQLAKGLSEGCF
jgi:hypothetical protein